MVAILLASDKSSKAAVDPLCAVLEVGLVVAITQLECVGGEASGLWLALFLHLGVVHDVGVQAPRPLQLTVKNRPI